MIEKINTFLSEYEKQGHEALGGVALFLKDYWFSILRRL